MLSFVYIVRPPLSNETIAHLRQVFTDGIRTFPIPHQSNEIIPAHLRADIIANFLTPDFILSSTANAKSPASAVQLCTIRIGKLLDQVVRQINNKPHLTARISPTLPSRVISFVNSL